MTIHSTIACVGGAAIICRGSRLFLPSRQVQHVKASSLLGKGGGKRPSDWAKVAKEHDASLVFSLSKLPDDVTEHTNVLAITLCVPHTCRTGGREEDVGSQSSVSLSSASALIPSALKGLTGPQLVIALKPGFDKASCRWKLADVRREMKEVEPLAKTSQAAFVLAKLRGSNVLPKEHEMLLLQGYASMLIRNGFGVVLHRSSAAAIRACIFMSAKSQYLALVQAAKKSGRTVTNAPFEPTGAPSCGTTHACTSTHSRIPHSPSYLPSIPTVDLSALLTRYPDVATSADSEFPYLMGWTLVPPEQMNNFGAFMPVDAFDCCQKRGAAQGTMAVRSTKNANNNIQVRSHAR